MMKLFAGSFSLFFWVVFLFPIFCQASVKIPDTGQITSYTNTFGEDSDYTINPPSYTKLDAGGHDLPDSAAAWTMVRDNVTGLIWEVKTDDGSIHDKDSLGTLASDTVTITVNNPGAGGA